MKFNAKRMESEILKDLLNNNGENYLELNNFIIEKFNIVKDEFIAWLEEADLRVYEGINYDTVIDSWFYVQHLDGKIEVKNDTFTIIPPHEYEDNYKNYKLEYPNTKEGLTDAFFNTIMPGCVCRVEMYGKEYFICVDEM